MLHEQLQPITSEMSPNSMTAGKPARCSACKEGTAFPIPFSMAFQPIFDLSHGSVYAYEALVRMPGGEGAGPVLAHVTDENRYAFDQACRVRALSLAAELGLHHTGAMLAINFMPGAVYSPAACLQLTLQTADRVGFPKDQLIFEITEHEKLVEPEHLLSIITEYCKQGFRIALDDFGAGHSGLSLLIDFPTEIVKLDMKLTRKLHLRPRAAKVVRAAVALAHELGSKVVAEGIETIEELRAVRACGIDLIQGYLLARPGFECLPSLSRAAAEFMASSPEPCHAG